MARILLVDDEEALRSSLGYALRRAGHDVVTAADGTTVLEQAEVFRPDVVLLDRMLPGLDGMTLCGRLHDVGEAAIIMLTARDGDEDRVAGLETGADDYVVKPFNTRELLARIAAVLRHREHVQQRLHEDRALVARLEQVASRRDHADRQAGDSVARGALAVGDIRLDPDRGAVTVRGVAVPLTPVEVRLLHALMRRPGEVVTRTELLREAVEAGAAGGRDAFAALDAHVHALLAKLEEDPRWPAHLRPVPGIGYTFR